MKKLLLISLLTISFAASAQKKEVKDSLKVIPLTGDTKFISINDIYRKADVYKDSVMARQYDSFIGILNAIIGVLITEQKNKQ